MKSKVQTISTNFYSPRWWVNGALPWFGKKIIEKRWDIIGRHDIMSADWDNLIVLDACRYDMFKQNNTIEGELSYVISPGSSSAEFLEETFRGETYYDAVYVTANPHHKLIDLDGVFYDVLDVWDFGWDNDLKTVTPRKMTEVTKKAHTEYPNKRILTHFMQPHYPFVGEKAKEIGQHAGFEYSVRTAKTGEGSRDHENIWKMLREGRVEKDEVWEAYIENLNIVLENVEELIDFFDQKTIITSDHGNLVGEYIFPFLKPKYGHPSGLHAPELVKVPWLVVDSGSRKTITAEQSTHESSSAEVSGKKEVKDRLADLGYM